ncbi:accessory Sec system translocase SecA2 [Rhodocytophaga rosea]|uniref:Protein translocase subunit SecA n=1 Tax=Rhodocytophaga rosea TaxID=2704465 RepID=A0A6C0GUM7_9BACT|nr:DEAD/DEAH box helicase [Rhodocytophaga rosea]QHT71514.1 accessory Sec system translocase SecA2 [Rhodocytophaga rosea]
MKAIQQVKTFFQRLKSSNITDNLLPYQEQFNQILAQTNQLSLQSDAELQALALSLKSKAKLAPSVDTYLVDLYALVIQAFIRTLSITPYAVQILAAIALSQRTVIEMQTGEGKTLVAVFPACLQAMSGKGVHVLTFNDYLARRDAMWTLPVYTFLGLSVGYIEEEHTLEEKRRAYHCEVTYTTAKQVGFDYLRSCMAYTLDEIVIRELHCAIVDEADALLIDEARNPLVLAANLEVAAIDLTQVARFVTHLQEQRDYLTDEYARNVYLTEWGSTQAEHYFRLQNLYDSEQHPLLTAINLALQAKALLHRDIDYIIEGDQIKLIDECTGRVVEDRKWPNGLQSAVEAKEGLPIQSEGRILNSISLQHLMACYEKVSGMTGTARQAAEEFAKTYGLGVTVIPTHKPYQRKDHPDRVYTHKTAKLQAILQEVDTIHRRGRPILIGTLTVRESEELQAHLQQHGITCTVLNARHHEREAAIIEKAGMLSAVTIATNMAGRGTDIRLGGKEAIDRERIIALGGLHIIGTNRHESNRIDKQLKGRAGRQGDPGSTQFIISMEDDLMVKYNLKSLLPARYQQIRQEQALENTTVSKSIDQAQRIIEGQLHEMRQTLYRYSSFIETHRKIFLTQRQYVLFSNDNNLSPLQQGYILYQYDRLWSEYLTDIASIREGIFWERMAGREPLTEFYKKSDVLFQDLLSLLETTLTQMHTLPDEDLKIKRPSATWTYIVSDNPFERPLAGFLRRLAMLKF